MEREKHTKQSKRIPGEPFRYFNATGLAEMDKETMTKMAVHGDGKVGVPVRTATAKDAERIGEKPKPSPLV